MVQCGWIIFLPKLIGYVEKRGSGGDS